MHKEKKSIKVRQAMWHGLRNSLTCVVEALVWAGCGYAAAKMPELKAEAVPSFAWSVFWGWGFVFLLIVTSFIPNNAYSRTARRDVVVACAMKTALVVCVLALAVFTERTSLQLFSCIFFCIALTAERLILNSLFIRYSIRHSEYGVIICNEKTVWQEKALLQNSYGLKLNRLEMQMAQQMPQKLAEYLAGHPETESIYCTPSALPATELEAIAHISCERGLVLHLLPQPVFALPQIMQSECRGTINVLSPAKLPLQSIFNKMLKRLTDIVLSLLVLITIFPPFALIAFICIKRQSSGPVLITRHLCGMNGKVFQSLTFRTRHYDAAPSFLDDINDPGYFPFGKFLTHSKLEQLPQFFCILRGSMTIVGSQTMRPEQYADYRQKLKQLFASDYRLKAGITSHRFSTEGKSGTEADVWYYRNWGFWLDLRIMLQRIGTLLSKSKAKSINYI